MTAPTSKEPTRGVGEDLSAARVSLTAGASDLATPGNGGGPTSAGLPDVLPGHWSSREGREMAETYATWARHDIGRSDLSDFQLANAVFMASRTDLDLIVYQTAAKERIRWLSVQLAIALANVRSDKS